MFMVIAAVWMAWCLPSRPKLEKSALPLRKVVAVPSNAALIHSSAYEAEPFQKMQERDLYRQNDIVIVQLEHKYVQIEHELNRIQ